ncbi:MAG: hypothetical protein PF508_22180 [Spirochaeta sp.]|nr:hypothetical protein [Spirochaeta sp.]
MNHRALRIPHSVFSLIVLSVFLLVSFPAPVPAIPEIPLPQRGAEVLEEAETLIYSQRGSDDQIFGLLDAAEQSFGDIGERGLRAYWIARTYLARAIRYNQFDNSRNAERAATAGLQEIEVALDGDPFSEGLRVQADLHSQMMMAKGLFYMIRNGDTARDAALDALERAPRSIKAQITVAGFLLNAPPMAGGDTEQARLVLERALAQEPASRNDRFLILGWLAQASFSLDDNDAAEQYFAEAFAIYPDSEWLLEIGDEILD